MHEDKIYHLGPTTLPTLIKLLRLRFYQLPTREDQTIFQLFQITKRGAKNLVVTCNAPRTPVRGPDALYTQHSRGIPATVLDRSVMAWCFPFFPPLT